MKILIMTTKKADAEKQLELYNTIVEKTGERRLKPSIINYDGMSTAEIKSLLSKDSDEAVIITADSRLLKFVHSDFLLSRVYFSDGENVLKLTNGTRRTLRQGHNLMKLFDSGEFTISDFRHEPEYVKCPDCNGQGGDMGYDLEDCVECPTCEGQGIVPEGTKGWIENLLLSKL